MKKVRDGRLSKSLERFLDTLFETKKARE